VNTEEGSDRREGLTVDPEERIDSRSKASKPRSLEAGSGLPVKRKDDNGKGEPSGDEPGAAANREKSLNGRNPGRGSGMQQARKSERWRKPSRG